MWIGVITITITIATWPAEDRDGVLPKVDEPVPQSRSRAELRPVHTLCHALQATREQIRVGPQIQQQDRCREPQRDDRDDVRTR
jgi:hypothetical protein